MKKDKTLQQIVGLGIIAGMRATFAPAIAAHFLSRKNSTSLAKSRLAFIQSPTAAFVTKLLSAAEITGDKLPNTPNRIAVSPAIARAASGAFAGAIIATAKKADVTTGALIGGTTALAATFATFYLRKYISKTTFVKEPITGAFEDAIAVGGGVLIMRES